MTSTTQPPMYKRHVLAVDSRSRENPDITTPSKYRVVFPPIRNIKMVRLMSTEIPNSEYVVNDRNHTLYLWDGATLSEHTVTLTNGTYTGSEMANEVNLRLNVKLGATFGQIFQATTMTSTTKLRIDRVDGNTFHLKFVNKSGTAAVVLGFDASHDSVMKIDPVSGNQYTESDNVLNLAGENYIFLCIKGLSTVTSTEKVNDVFAKVIYNIPPRSIAFDSFVSNAFIYPEAQAVMSQLDVSFVRQDGTLVNFNTIEHSFTLEYFTV